MEWKFNQEVNSAQHSLEACERGMPPAWRAAFSPCVSAVGGNVGDSNWRSQASSVAQVAALAMGLTGDHWHYLAAACLWLTNLTAAFTWLVKDVDVEDKEFLGNRSSS